jgi:hypothetical protein
LTALASGYNLAVRGNSARKKWGLIILYAWVRIPPPLKFKEPSVPDDTGAVKIRQSGGAA